MKFSHISKRNLSVYQAVLLTLRIKNPGNINNNWNYSREYVKRRLRLTNIIILQNNAVRLQNAGNRGSHCHLAIKLNSDTS